MPSTSITVLHEPMTWPRARFARVGEHVRTFTDIRTELGDYIQMIRTQMAAQIPEPIKGPVAINIDFFFKRPERLCTKKLAGALVRHDKRPDIDNCIKAVVSALNGVIVLDDSQFYSVRASKYYVSPDHTPQVVIALIWD